MKDETRVPAAELQEFTKGVFIAAGLPSEDAALEAEVLVWANLRGVDSHGVLRIPWYVELIAKGDMIPWPQIRVEKETAATVLIDGDRALGPVVTTVAMRRAIDKARAAGIGWAVIRNTTHQGAMAYYALMAVEAGMAGIAIVCSPPTWRRSAPAPRASTTARSRSPCRPAGIAPFAWTWRRAWRRAGS